MVISFMWWFCIEEQETEQAEKFYPASVEDITAGKPLTVQEESWTKGWPRVWKQKEKGEIPCLGIGDGYTASSGRARGRFLSKTMEQRTGVNWVPVVWSRLSVYWNVHCKSLILFSPDLQTTPEHLLFFTGLPLSSCLCLPFLDRPQPSCECFSSDPNVSQQGEVIATLTALLGNCCHRLIGLIVHNCIVGHWGDYSETLLLTAW